MEHSLYSDEQGQKISIAQLTDMSTLSVADVGVMIVSGHCKTLQKFKDKQLN